MAIRSEKEIEKISSRQPIVKEEVHKLHVQLNIITLITITKIITIYNNYDYLFYRGDTAFCQVGDIRAVLWLDNQPVTMLSSNWKPETTNVQRKQKYGTRIEVTSPKSIVSYNQYMGGVDRGDQLKQ